MRYGTVLKVPFLIQFTSRPDADSDNAFSLTAVTDPRVRNLSEYTDDGLKNCI